ncbi:MAG TPA: hypothetical protein VHO02_09105 [Fibrobacteria bacterium]|jgi:hypothetical protein|nr:hypothetical protein [Fibrobacteria bacterium]
MGKFLHSLPWTLALALAQAGEVASLPFPVDDTALATAEDGLTPAESAGPFSLTFGDEARGIDLSLED